MAKKEINNEEFDRILSEICEEEGGANLLTIPGVYECVSEYFNNDVLDRYRWSETDRDVDRWIADE